MGYGDEIMGSGLAKGAVARGKRVAFGDGRQIIWSNWAPVIYKHNPNVAPPGHERDKDLEWIPFYKKSRNYNYLTEDRTKWVWNYKFKVTPGEFFFDTRETETADKFGSGFIVIEPNAMWNKPVSVNKDWGETNYKQLTNKLASTGRRLVQFQHTQSRRILNGVMKLNFGHDFRQAIAILKKADLYIGPEGGMHHAAAAVGVKAVVIFGGFIPPQVTGYDMHINLTGGAEACGSINPCEHCKKAMQSITVDEVYQSAVTLCQ